MGKHKPTMKFLSFNFARDLCYKLQQRAEELNVSRSSLIIDILRSEMDAKGVVLTPENKAKCEAETAAEVESRKVSWTNS